MKPYHWLLAFVLGGVLAVLGWWGYVMITIFSRPVLPVEGVQK